MFRQAEQVMTLYYSWSPTSLTPPASPSAPGPSASGHDIGTGLASFSTVVAQDTISTRRPDGPSALSCLPLLQVSCDSPGHFPGWFRCCQVAPVELHTS